MLKGGRSPSWSQTLYGGGIVLRVPILVLALSFVPQLRGQPKGVHRAWGAPHHQGNVLSFGLGGVQTRAFIWHWWVRTLPLS